MYQLIVNPRVGSTVRRLDDMIAALPGGPWLVSVQPCGRKATGHQHAFYRANLQRLAEFTGQPVADLHQHFVDEVAAAELVSTASGAEFRRPSTAEFNSHLMGQLIDRLLAEMAEVGL